jgi:acetyl-CoA/propionyl-CoA carboxylase biotin carboxyl carrier protein
MNTRLQVEHPVTELVTGIDLVQAQILVASGEGLPWIGRALTQRGHAIEARVYAEDPSRGFLPQAGPILLYREPRRPGIRVDAGIAEGGEVSVHYDPLVAKVIASAETRDRAIDRLRAALRDYPILGIATNVSYLLRILDDPRFRKGEIDADLLDREGLPPTVEDDVPVVVAEALAAHEGAGRTVLHDVRPVTLDPWNTLTRWRL